MQNVHDAVVLCRKHFILFVDTRDSLFELLVKHLQQIQPLL
jgi:hypothetical protein